MENKSIPTITEHFIQFYKENEEYPSIAAIKEFTTDPYFIATMKSLHEYAVLFAKHHVRECKEAIKEKAELKYGKDGCLYINPDSIENAYSEDEIK